MSYNMRESLKAVVWLIVLLLFGLWFFPGWYGRGTADIRQIYVHGANADHAPEVYMSDGTVWVLEFNTGEIAMLQGDKVRYENMPTDPYGCVLKDVTTGFQAPAFRISAPFKHTSCPTESPMDRLFEESGD